MRFGVVACLKVERPRRYSRTVEEKMTHTVFTFRSGGLSGSGLSFLPDGPLVRDPDITAVVAARARAAARACCDAVLSFLSSVALISTFFALFFCSV